jgi:hypothetical protein
MKEIQLGGKYGHLSAIVDDEDYEDLIQYNWLFCQNGKGIYVRRTYGEAGLRKNQFLHNYLMGRVGVDHINHNGLDNRRSNLRFATAQENIKNRPKFFEREGRQFSSQYKGVTNRRNRWRATISVNYKQLFLGSFEDEVEAARAYDRAAIEHYGEFASINFPEDQ